MSKYPPTERVASGALREGDRVLIRERGSDTLMLDGFDEHPWQDRPTIPTGVHTVTAIRSELRPGWKRSSRYYSVWLDGSHPSLLVPLVTTVSSVQRWNRVTE